MHPSDGTQTTRTTFRYELLRAGTAGILETAGSTFLLTIALKQFHAGAIAKALVAGSGSVGLLLSPVVVAAVTHFGWPTGKAASRILAFGALCFLLATLVPGLPIFVACSLLAMTTSSAIIPLLTQMYQDNYPEPVRGRLFSRTVMVRIAAAAVFSKVAGDALNGRIESYRELLFCFAGALALASFCLARCPTRPIPHHGGGAHPFRAMRFAREDRLFRRTLICWMLMGFANLMMLPLRVEYLANPQHQAGRPGATVATIALLTGVIPHGARLVMSPIWGHLFDRMNFFALRITLNVGFALGILTFFTTDSMTGMVLGAIVFGISNAGGDVAWSLWVTKFAPSERVADYMSVHTALTGVRGVLAPFAAFISVNHFAPASLAAFSAILIGAATLLLVPEIKSGRKAPPSTALVEEVSE